MPGSISKAMNSGLLSAVLHQNFLGLAMTDSRMATITVTENQAHTWGVDEDRLHIRFLHKYAAIIWIYRETGGTSMLCHKINTLYTAQINDMIRP